MSKWNDSFYSGWPKKDGRYLVDANDIVSSWEEELNFKDGVWYMLDGNSFHAIVDRWREI